MTTTTLPYEDDRARAVPRREAADSPQTLIEAARRFITYGSPRFLVTALSISLVTRLALGGWSPWDLVLVAGIFAAWPVQEWMIHVFILHYRPFRIAGRTIDFAVPRKHRAHHRDPWHIDLVLIPVQGFFISLPILLSLCLGLLPTLSLSFTALAFYLLMSLRYEWIHFLVHTRYRPRSAWYRRLWLNHRLHHCKNEHYWFGVTMLGGDRLLGTSPAKDSVPTSPTCMTIGAEHTLGV